MFEQVQDEQGGDVLNWFKATELIPSAELIDQFKPPEVCDTFTSHNVSLKHLPLTKIINMIKNDPDVDLNIRQAEEEHTDLVPAIYEGGLKVWECTQDLADFITSSRFAGREGLAGMRVLDLGCGAGLLGLTAFALGAARVDFQDYNKGVLRCVTIPNVLLNTPTRFTDCHFYAGDWRSFAQLDSDAVRYDVILSSETIYNPTSHAKILAILQHMLNPTGVAFIAGKTYYFGVGGGMRQFEALIEADDTFRSSVCWKQQPGVQREILEVTFK